MRRTWLFLGLMVGVTGSAVMVLRPPAGKAQPVPASAESTERPAAKLLPLSRVVLFSSGVGYFQREGVVDGNARLDLTFPVGDVNDLLKSLVLQDSGKGKVGTISYDSQEPLDRTLKSFALDLTYNPTFGQILNQARGEKVEVLVQTAAGAQPAPMTGIIVGMESQVEGNKENHQLNLLCAEGMRCVPLAQVQRMRFLNPVLDGEFHRALEALAASHDNQKRTVSLRFSGEGKRPVKVGYVIENPIWKMSYRLVLDKKGAPALQGWALVENVTDEDWKDVGVTLVSGRPISFQMDLYQPLFVPRPTVEPELFASLRPPPIYQGSIGVQLGGMGALGLLGGLGGLGGMPGPSGGNFGASGGNLGMIGGNSTLNRYQVPLPRTPDGPNPLDDADGNQVDKRNRLTYESLQKRRAERESAKEEAKKVGAAIANMDPIGSVSSAATGEEVGDYFQYHVEEKVNLSRQKSALLPLVNQEVAGRRVSVFNEKIHHKTPLLSLKVKNTTGQTLAQGPVAVFEGGTYLGDARLPDLQPDEERLISFALDQGVEVKAQSREAPEQITGARIVKGTLFVSNQARETRTILVNNRSKHERALIVEHPIRKEWKLVTPVRPDETTRDLYRFEWKVPAGKAVKQEISEQQIRATEFRVDLTGQELVARLHESPFVSPKVKDALRVTAEREVRVLDTRRDRDNVESQLKKIAEDQSRLRANLEKVPPTSAAYKRYLEKFDKQETQIEALQTQLEEKQKLMEKLKKEFEEYLAGLTVE